MMYTFARLSALSVCVRQLMRMHFSRAALTIGILLSLCSPLYVRSQSSIAISDPVARTNDPEKLFRGCKDSVSQGLYWQARDCMNDMLHLMNASGNNKRAIEMLEQIGEICLGIGKYSEANYYYQQLLQRRDLPDSVRSNAFISMGRIYHRLQALSLAIRSYEKSLELPAPAGDFRAQSRALLGLASVLFETGNLKRAESCLDQARRLRVEDPLGEATADWLAGRMHRYSMNSQLSMELLETARKKLNSIPDASIDHALLLCDLSDVYLDLKQPDPAYEVAMEALQKAKELKADDVALTVNLTVARALRANGRDEEASQYLTRAVGRIEKLLITTPDLSKADVLEQGQASYRELVEILMQSDREQDAWDALRPVDYARGRAILSLLNKRQPTALSHEQKRALEETARRIAYINRQRLYPSKDALSPPVLEKQLREAELDYDEIVLQSQLESQKEYKPPVKRREAAKELHPDELLITFFLGKDKSYCWLITADKVKSVRLPARALIENGVSDYLKVVSKRPSSLTLPKDLEQARKRGRELYSLLLGGLAGEIKPGQKLLIEPDGNLFYLPFETLITGGRYLVEDHPISYVPSMSVLELLNERAKSRGQSYKFDLLAFGAPLFSQVQSSNNGESPQPGGGSNSPQGPGTTTAPYYLRGAQDEIQRLSRKFEPSRRRIHIGSDATEEMFKREELTEFRYIQLATHAIIDSELPRRSHIVMAPGRDPLEDGILQLDEVAGLDLRCDLIILSACSTARGQLKRGEGVIGLTSAFLAAGASAAAVTLWDVSDASAPEFMERFYRYLVARKSPTDALRQAKIEFIKANTNVGHPFHWAPFILVGETR